MLGFRSQPTICIFFMIWLANYVSEEVESSESDVNEEDGSIGDLAEDSDSSENNNVSSDCKY